MEAKRIRNYSGKNNFYETENKSLNKSINKSRLNMDSNYSRSKSGNRVKEHMSPLRDKNLKNSKLQALDKTNYKTALGSKLDEINKNIQIEKKKLRSNNLNNINDLSVNQVLNMANNYENNSEFIQRSNKDNRLRGKSEIDVNKLLKNNKQFDMNSMNIVNQNQNLNEFKFVRNKSPNSNFLKAENSFASNKNNISYYNVNNFTTTLAKNYMGNPNNNLNHNYNYNNSNFIDQSNFTFSNGQNLRELYSKSDLSSNNVNHNFYSYTENTPNIKKNIIDFNSNNQNLIYNNNNNNNYIQNSNLENYKKKLIGNFNNCNNNNPIFKLENNSNNNLYVNNTVNNVNKNIHLKELEEMQNVNYKKINNLNTPNILSTKNVAKLNNTRVKSHINPGELINSTKNDNSFDLKRRITKTSKSPEIRNKSMLSGNNALLNTENISNRNNKVFCNKENLNLMLNTSQKKQSNDLFFNSNVNNNYHIAREKNNNVRNLTPNNYSKNQNRLLNREKTEYSNSRSKSNKRGGANVLEYPANFSKDNSTNDLLNNSNFRVNRVATSKNKNTQKITTSKSPTKSPKFEYGNMSNLSSTKNKTVKKLSDKNSNLSTSKGRNSNTTNLNNSNYNYSNQSTMKQNKNTSGINNESDPNLNYLNQTRMIKSNYKNNDLTSNQKNYNLENDKEINFKNISPDRVFSKSNTENTKSKMNMNHNKNEEEIPYNFQPHKSAFESSKDMRGNIYTNNVNHLNSNGSNQSENFMNNQYASKIDRNLMQNNNNINNHNFQQSFSGCEGKPNNYIIKEQLQGSLIQNLNHSGSNGFAFLNNLNPHLKQGISNLQESNTESKLPSLLNFETTLKKFNKLNLNNAKYNNDALQINELETKMAENIVISEASNSNSNLNNNSMNMRNNDLNNNRNNQLNNLKFNNNILKNLNLKDKNKLGSVNENNINVNNNNNNNVHYSNNALNNNQTENNTNITTQSSSNALNSNVNMNLNPNSSSFKSTKNFNNSLKSNSNSIMNTNTNSLTHNNIQYSNTNFNSKNDLSSNGLLEANLQSQGNRKKSCLDLKDDNSNTNLNQNMNNNNNFNLNTNANTHNTYTNTNSNLININSINNGNGTPQPIRHGSSYTNTNTNSTYNYDESKNTENNKVKHIEELHLELVRMIQNYNLAVRVQEKENEEENNMQTVNKCEERDIN